MIETYDIYGLRLHTNCPLPALLSARVAGQDAGDLHFELRETLLDIPPLAAVQWGSPLHETGSHRIWSGTSREGTYWRLSYGKASGELIDFVVNPSGSHIWAARQTPPGCDAVSIATTATLLAGSVLAVALRLRGVLCLHASAIVVGSQAVVIMGYKGAGKSTLAAALAKRGHAVLSDDLSALTVEGSTWRVHSGYPRLRLWPSTLNALQTSPAELPYVLPTVEKRYLPLASADEDGVPWRFEGRSRPVGGIYVITRDKERTSPRIDAAIPAPDRLLALVSEVCARFLVLDSREHAREFQAMSQLALSVPLQYLQCPHGLEHLPAVCALIEQQAGHALSGAA